MGGITTEILTGCGLDAGEQPGAGPLPNARLVDLTGKQAETSS
jgi:hypothetical protein